MGFATAENIIYAVTHGMGTTLLRMFTAVPAHAICGVIIGYYVGLAKFKPNPLKYMIIGILLAACIHSIYDFFLFMHDYPALTILSFVSLGVAVTFSFIAICSHQKRSPFKHRADSV